MATVAKVKIETGFINHWKWEGLAASGDVGEAVPIPKNAKVSVQSFGTYTGSLSVNFQGSLEDSSPTNWFNLTDQAGTVIAHTDGAGNVVAENVKWIRPRAGAGTGSADVDAIIMAVR